jgi:hypothetical protein
MPLSSNAAVSLSVAAPAFVPAFSAPSAASSFSRSADTHGHYGHDRSVDTSGDAALAAALAAASFESDDAYSSSSFSSSAAAPSFAASASASAPASASASADSVDMATRLKLDAFRSKHCAHLSLAQVTGAWLALPTGQQEARFRIPLLIEALRARGWWRDAADTAPTNVYAPNAAQASASLSSSAAASSSVHAIAGASEVGIAKSASASSEPIRRAGKTTEKWVETGESVGALSQYSHTDCPYADSKRA